MAQTPKLAYAIILFFFLCLVVTNTKFRSCISDNDCPYDYCNPPKYQKCVWSSCYCVDQYNDLLS
ncbi:hypothetical protein RYX36_029291 [Vicia faba]